MKTKVSVFSGLGIWNVWLWMAAGLIFVAINLSGNSEPRSPVWFSELILYGLMLAGMWRYAKNGPRKIIKAAPKNAALAYLFLVWLFGMLFELSLTVTGEGIGGMHPQTLPSFVLAQGDYIMIALVSYLVIRETRASFISIFFFAGGKSLTEGLIFNNILIPAFSSSQFWLSPLLIAYYTMAYSSFIALPLLFIDEEKLWKNSTETKRYSIPFYWLIGFVLALAIRLVWGLLYSPIATRLLRLPPGL